MPREVVINNSTFIVNSFSSPDATETLDELLKRVIVNNAEMEFKKRWRNVDAAPSIPMPNNRENP